MYDLTSPQRDALSHLVERLSPGQQQALDPRDETDLGLIELFLDLSNKRSERYPALHAGLANGHAPPDNAEDDVKLVDLGIDSGGRATARAWHSPQGSSLLSGSAAVALDSASGELLAFGTATQVGEALCEAATKTASAKPADGGVTGLGFYHGLRSADAQPSFGVVMDRRSALNASTSIRANVTAPKICMTGHTCVIIAVGRIPGQQSCTDVDYCYCEPKQWLTNPNLLVPFIGNVDVQAQIDADSNGNINGLTAASSVSAGGVTLSCTLPANLTASQWVNVPQPTSAPGVMAWNYPYDHLGQDSTQSLQYPQTEGLVSDVEGFFLFTFTVPIVDSDPVTFNVCSTGRTDQPSQNCTKIPNLAFYWHCVSAGTRVTLADGATVPIESVDNTMRVRTGVADGTLGVEATTRGEHVDDGDAAGGVLRLVTEAALELTLTAHHPVVTPNGPVAAADLEPGTVVVTEAGSDRVRSLERAASNGAFCNLKLVDRHDRASGVVPAAGSFIANGIVVGDQVSLSAHHRATRLDPDYMLPRLPEMLHRDYESAVTDATVLG